MKYLDKRFSTPAANQAYRDNLDRIFADREPDKNPDDLPERIVLNDMDAARFERELDNPSPPNEKLVALFRNNHE